MKSDAFLHSVYLCSLMASIALLAASYPGLAFTDGKPEAATIAVTTTDDELLPDGDCSLREAIQAANSDSAVDGCPAGAGGDTIELPAGDYNLSLYGDREDDNASGDLDVKGETIIQGHGVTDTVIIGDGLDRVLHIHFGADVEVRQVAIVGGVAPNAVEDIPGEDGGGILNAGRLILHTVSVHHNSAGSGVNAFLSQPCWIGGSNGGGIASSGNLEIRNSIVYENRAGVGSSVGEPPIGGRGGDGGGIYSTGVITLTNSTVSNNHAGDAGFGLCSGDGGSGGGIFSGGEATLNNVTISANTTGWAYMSIHCSPPYPQFGTGGGIHGFANVNLKNTIIAGNSIDDCDSGLFTHGFNLIQNACDMSGGGVGDILGRDPLMAQLGDYGGPTWTHALFTGSPAIDAGSCTDIELAPITSDQRGEPRPQINNCDIGAYESPLVNPFQELFLPVLKR